MKNYSCVGVLDTQEQLLTSLNHAWTNAYKNSKQLLVLTHINDILLQWFLNDMHSKRYPGIKYIRIKQAYKEIIQGGGNTYF